MTEPGLDRLADVREQFVAAQLAGDRRKALALINQSAGLEHASPSEVRTHVIRAAQAEIGRLWQTNAISIARNSEIAG